MTHITLTTFVVFLTMVGVGAVVFALARFASHGGLSPDAEDDAAPEEHITDEEHAVVAKVDENHDPHQ